MIVQTPGIAYWELVPAYYSVHSPTLNTRMTLTYVRPSGIVQNSPRTSVLEGIWGIVFLKIDFEKIRTLKVIHSSAMARL